MFSVKRRCGDVVIDSELFRKRVLGWLGNNSELYQDVLHQCIVSVFNTYLIEETVYNPLRQKRPIPVSVPEFEVET